MYWTRRVAVYSLAVGVLALAASALLFYRHSTRPNRPTAPQEARWIPAGPVSDLVTESIPIRRGDTFEVLLERVGLDPAEKPRIVAAVKDVFDVRKFRAGSELTLTRREDKTLQWIEYAIDPDRELRLSRSPEGFEAAVVDVPGDVHVVPVYGRLRGSLFESMENAGERPELAIQVAEIFAWDLDFYTDPQEGDEFCLLLEKKEYANGQPPTYRRVFAARYDNAGKVYNAYLFPDENGKPRYYSHDGRSLQAAFLRSPMKFEARVSSHYSRSRFHPVLKIYRPHLGTDYAAPTGTPVQAIADGTVVASGYSGGSGNIIRIRHANGFESAYMHLSRRLVRRGQRVSQGQRIGLVGATGLATGPHLDFRVSKGGKYLNFERLNPPRATKVVASRMPAFETDRDRYAAALDAARLSATSEIASSGANQPAASTN